MTLEAGAQLHVLALGQRAVDRLGQDAADGHRRERRGSGPAGRPSRHQRVGYADRRSAVSGDGNRAGGGGLGQRGARTRISTYKTVTPAPIKFNVQPAGGGTALFTDPQALVGEAVGTTAPSSTGAGCTVGIDCNVIPGTTVPGSAVTLIVFPRSVAGSKATNFTTPGAVTMWDRRPATAVRSRSVARPV